MAIDSINVVKKIARKITSADRDNIIVLFDNVNPVPSIPSNDIISINGFLKNLKGFSRIASLQEAQLPDIRLEDSEPERRIKALDIEWQSPRKQLDMLVSADGQNWIEIGSISLIRQQGYPYRMYSLLDFFTDGLADEFGDNGKAGCRIIDVGYGLLEENDVVTIHGSYLQEIVFKTQAQPININLACNGNNTGGGDNNTGEGDNNTGGGDNSTGGGGNTIGSTGNGNLNYQLTSDFQEIISNTATGNTNRYIEINAQNGTALIEGDSFNLLVNYSSSFRMIYDKLLKAKISQDSPTIYIDFEANKDLSNTSEPSISEVNISDIFEQIVQFGTIVKIENIGMNTVYLQNYQGGWLVELTGQTPLFYAQNIFAKCDTGLSSNVRITNIGISSNVFYG